MEGVEEDRVKLTIENVTSEGLPTVEGYRTIYIDPSKVCMYFMVRPLFRIIIP